MIAKRGRKFSRGDVGTLCWKAFSTLLAESACSLINMDVTPFSEWRRDFVTAAFAADARLIIAAIRRILVFIESESVC